MTDDINLFSIISSIVSNELIKTLVLFLLIPILMKYYETKYLSDFAQKKNVWLNFIQKNRHIQDCFSKYNQIEKESQPTYLFNYMILIFSTFLFILLLLIVFSIALILYATINSIVPLSLDYFSHILFASVLISIPIILGQISNEIYEQATELCDEDILSKYSSVQKKYHFIFISSLVFSFFEITLFFQNTSHIYYAIGSILFGILVYGLISNKRFYTQKVKNCVNKDFNRNFPFLEISTVGAERFIGKLKNIYDHESITLIENDVEIKIMWSAVASLKETKSKYHGNQKHLDDFFRD